MRYKPFNINEVKVGDVIAHESWGSIYWKEWAYTCTAVDKENNLVIVRRKSETSTYYFNAFVSHGWFLLNEKQKTGFAKFIQKIEEKPDLLKQVKKKQAERPWVQMKEHDHG